MVVEVAKIPTLDIFLFFISKIFSSIKICMVLQGITKKSGPAFSKIFAAFTKKGRYFFSPLFFVITSSSIFKGNGIFQLKIGGLCFLFFLTQRLIISNPNSALVLGPKPPITPTVFISLLL